MPKQTLASHHRLYESLIQEDRLQSFAQEHMINYPQLDLDHIKSLIKEISRIAISVFNPLACPHNDERKRRINCLKNAALSDREVPLERKEEFPSEVIELYFLRRDNEYNVEEVEEIFRKDGLCQDNSANYLPLIQNDLIPKISSHIISIVQQTLRQEVQQDLRQKKTIKEIISRGPRSTPLESILEERKDDSRDGKPSTPPLLKQSSTGSLSDSTNSSPERIEDNQPDKLDSQSSNTIGGR